MILELEREDLKSSLVYQCPIIFLLSHENISVAVTDWFAKLLLINDLLMSRVLIIILII